MTYTIHIENWLPTSDNKLSHCHWSVANRRKIGDMNMIGVCAYKAGVPKATGKRMVEIVLTISRKKRGRKPDPTNFYKSILDALVKCGYLLDDNAKNMEHLPTRLETGDITSTIIYLTDL